MRCVSRRGLLVGLFLEKREAMQSHASIPVFILAGGLGTRISEETVSKPKPMIEVGEIPLLVHIMRSYYRQGFNDFVICSGYRSWEIKQFFLNYEFRMNHLTIDHRTNAAEMPQAFGRSVVQEKWRVRVIDTGQDCMTGARVARAFDAISSVQSFERFALTYGDGVSDVDLKEELEFHLAHQKKGTVLGVNPPGRFGVLAHEPGGKVSGFLEKPSERQDTINAGFFFFERSFREYLSSDPACVLETTPLERLAHTGELMMFKHQGFWHPMDTYRDKAYLEKLWQSGKAPWLTTAISQGFQTPERVRHEAVSSWGQSVTNG